MENNLNYLGSQPEKRFRINKNFGIIYHKKGVTKTVIPLIFGL